MGHPVNSDMLPFRVLLYQLKLLENKAFYDLYRPWCVTARRCAYNIFTFKTDGPHTVPTSGQNGNRNIARCVAGFTLLKLAFSMFDDSYSQWLYVRFERDVLGDNYTHTKNHVCLIRV